MVRNGTKRWCSMHLLGSIKRTQPEYDRVSVGTAVQHQYIHTYIHIYTYIHTYIPALIIILATLNDVTRVDTTF